MQRRTRWTHRAGRGVVVALLTAVVGLLTVLAPATAQAVPAADDGGRTVTGRLTNSAEDNGPVPDVTIDVTVEGGTKTYSGTTDDDGVYEIAVPASETGALTIKLDRESLPEGVELRSGARDTLTNSSNLSTIRANFPLGPDTRQVGSNAGQIPELIYNGLLFGVMLALAALGLSMIFGTTGLTNFAHGELITFGAFAAYLFNVAFGVPLILAGVLAVIVAAGFGWAQDAGLWRPLRKRGTGLIAMMIVSIGLQFLLRNVYQYFSGGRQENYKEFNTPDPLDFFGLFNYTARDLVVFAVSIGTLVAVTLALSKTRLGRATRAVSDNPALAASTGINVDRVISTVWIVGTALAALAGIFMAFNQAVQYQLGAQVLLLVFAAVVLGGLGSIWGAILGSLIIGVIIELSTLVVPAELKNACALVLLIVILLVRPQGLLGRKERIG